MSLPEAPENLDRFQRWMLSVISHPEGVLAGVASTEAQQSIALEPDKLDQVVCRSRNLTSLERLQIYANAYYARLFECLRDEFPALAYLLGDEAFNGFAFEYLQRYPSRSYTLAQLGSNFPQFLRETRPADAAEDGTMRNWPDFLIDLATLERTYSEVFHAPGREGQPPLDLSSVAPQRWPQARLIPIACLRMLELRFPAHEFASAVRGGEAPSIPAASPTFLIVTRCNYLVRPYAVSAVEFQILQGLCEGESVEEVVSRAAETSGWDIDHLASKMRVWFQHWSSNGLFRKIDV